VAELAIFVRQFWQARPWIILHMTPERQKMGVQAMQRDNLVLQAEVSIPSWRNTQVW
jgi:hypothetical protein